MADEAIHRLFGLLAKSNGDGTFTLYTQQAAGETHIGQVGANALWLPADAAITRTAPTTAYTPHQAIGDAANCIFKVSNFFRVNGGTALYAGMSLRVNKASIAIPSGMAIRAHLYNTTPSSPPAADYSTFNMLVANEPYRLGHVDFANWTIGGSGSDMISSAGIPAQPSPWLLKAADGARDLYVVLEATAGFTPNASSIWLPRIGAVQN